MGLYSKSFRFEGGGRRDIGLKRTGKSCRLRWVNYLHPGLKRGKMTPHEEKLVLELHSQWGNRWSRIARKLPGRTDNEIKNYWRTHMRKEAQEKKRSKLPSSASSNCSTSSSSNNESNSDYKATTETDATFSLHDKEGEQEVYSMDDIWRDITSSDEAINPTYEQGSDHLISCPPIASPLWDYCPDTLWKMDNHVDEESKLFFPFNDPFLPC